MIFKAVYNKAIFKVEASSASMARRLLKRAYGITVEVEPVFGFKYSEKHLADAKVHERSMYGGT